MAQTLTENRKAAWRIQGIGPDPAHHLVIFKKTGGGRTLHRVLRPREVLKLSLFESVDSYEAYAVSTDDNLRHRFSRKYQAVGQTWTFTLDFNLHFRVSNAERLSLSLLYEDPLQRLEEEVGKVLSGTARHLPWEAMEREGEEFGAILRDAETTDGQGECKTNYQRLQTFAEDLGLELRHVEVTRTLTEIDIEDKQAEREKERLKRIARSEQNLAVERERLAHETEFLRDRLKLEREIAAAHGKQALQSMERLQAVLDGIGREGIRALSQSVDGVRSFPALHDALKEVQSIQVSLAALSGGQFNTSISNAATSRVLVQDAPEHLLVASTRVADPMERLVVQVFHHLRALDGNKEDKRRLLVTILHLIAEAGRGREADEEFLAACGDDLKAQLLPVESALEDEEVTFLRSILNFEELRHTLA